MDKKRRTRAEILTGTPPIKSWPTVLGSMIKDEHREQFRKNCEAVKMYVEGYPVSQIQEVTGVYRGSLPKMLSRSLQLSFDGHIMGYRALIPFSHLKEYTRESSVKHKYPEAHGGLSGLFTKTLKQYPKIEETLVKYIKKLTSHDLNVHEKKIRAKDLHNLFIECLKKAGVQTSQWPFNTKHQGLKTIQKYLNKILDESFSRSVTTREEQAAIAHLSVGTGHERFLIFEEPYDAVQLDSYSINAFFTAEFETPEGTIADVQLERIWLIAMIDSNTSVVIAYSIVYRSEISADDVLSLIRKAINPPIKIELTIPGLAYPEKGGLPSEVISQCQGAAWGALFLDGALAHLANAVHGRARKSLGFAINWGPVAHFERRPNIERYFSSISKDIFMRFPSTTGSNPGNGRAKNAEQNAVTYRIQAKEVEQLIAVYTANFNATPTEGNSFNSPLETLKYFVEQRADHVLLRHLPKLTGTTSVLMPLIISCTVRGGKASGRRPYVQIDGVRYTNPVLSQASSLIGKKIVVEMNEDDWRYGRSYIKDGGDLGILKAAGGWCLTKHNRRTRKIINSLITKKVIVVSSTSDPVRVYLSYLSTRKKNVGSKSQTLPPSHATEANRVANEGGLSRKIVDPVKKFTDDISLTELHDSRPSLIGIPMPDLNELLRRKK